LLQNLKRVESFNNEVVKAGSCEYGVSYLGAGSFERNKAEVSGLVSILNVLTTDSTRLSWRLHKVFNEEDNKITGEENTDDGATNVDQEPDENEANKTE
jgi:hypothetical protein